MKLAASILTAICAVGCASNTGTGVIAGVTVGGSAGGLIGGGSGGLIGTLTGAITGGLIGAALDAQDRKIMEKTSPRTVERMDQKQPLTLSDVIKLSLGGISDDAIIRYMNHTHSKYELTQTQIRRLLDSGVSQRIVNYMMDNR